MSLRVVELDGTGDRHLSFGDVSYVEPDARTAGIVVSRVRSQADIWRVPITGTPVGNVRGAVRLTRQTGAAQVPSVSPDEREVVYLSDNGGHGNLWVAAIDGSDRRQLTFERDPDVSIGVPVWSPSGDLISFIVTSSGEARQWLINRDGSGLRAFLSGFWASWSPDGKWLYYVVSRDNGFAIHKATPDGGQRVSVRADDAASPAVGADGTLYFTSPVRSASGIWEWAIRKARPENAEGSTLGRVSGTRIPVEYLNIHPIPSPDGKWLAQPLIDGSTTNLWLVNTIDGTMHPVTDFGDRPVVIGRLVAWSRDSRSIYAAVAETDADVVLLKGLR
jgi:Tol biopolymer transport system component